MQQQSPRTSTRARIPSFRSEIDIGFGAQGRTALGSARTFAPGFASFENQQELLDPARSSLHHSASLSIHSIWSWLRTGNLTSTFMICTHLSGCCRVPAQRASHTWQRSFPHPRWSAYDAKGTWVKPSVHCCVPLDYNRSRRLIFSWSWSRCVLCDRPPIGASLDCRLDQSAVVEVVERDASAEGGDTCLRVAGCCSEWGLRDEYLRASNLPGAENPLVDSTVAWPLATDRNLLPDQFQVRSLGLVLSIRARWRGDRFAHRFV